MRIQTTDAVQGLRELSWGVWICGCRILRGTGSDAMIICFIFADLNSHSYGSVTFVVAFASTALQQGCLRPFREEIIFGDVM